MLVKLFLTLMAQHRHGKKENFIMKSLLFLCCLFLLATNGFCDNRYLMVNINNGDVDGIAISPLNFSATWYIIKIIPKTELESKLELWRDAKLVMWDFNTETLIRRSDTAIKTIKDNKRKAEIRNKIRDLRATYLNALEESKEGFDVSVETATIKNTITTLKVEYQGLP